MKTDQRSNVTPPIIGDKDLVLAIRDTDDEDEIKLGHILCVVRKVEGKLILLKNVLQEIETEQGQKDCDERNYNMYKYLKRSSKWSLLKICSLENFNRAYIRFDSFQACKLYKEILNLSRGVNETRTKFPPVCVPKEHEALTSIKQLSASQQ